MWILGGRTSEGSMRWRSDEKRGARGWVKVGAEVQEIEIVVLTFQRENMPGDVASKVIAARLGAGFRRQVIVPVSEDSIFPKGRAP